MLCCGHLLSALGWLLVFTLSIIFAWDYGKEALNLVQHTRVVCGKKQSKLTALRTLRNELHNRLDSLLGTK